MSDEWDAKAREIQAALVEIISLVQDVYDVDIQKSAPALTAILNEADTAAERRGIERAAKVKVSMTNYEDEFGSVARVVSVSAEEAVDRMRAAIRALAQPAGASDKEGTGP